MDPECEAIVLFISTTKWSSQPAERLKSAGDQLPAAAQQAAEPEPVPILSHF